MKLSTGRRVAPVSRSSAARGEESVACSDISTSKPDQRTRSDTLTARQVVRDKQSTNDRFATTKCDRSRFEWSPCACRTERKGGVDSVQRLARQHLQTAVYLLARPIGRPHPNMNTRIRGGLGALERFSRYRKEAPGRAVAATEPQALTAIDTVSFEHGDPVRRAMVGGSLAITKPIRCTQACVARSQAGTSGAARRVHGGEFWGRVRHDSTYRGAAPSPGRRFASEALRLDVPHPLPYKINGPDISLERFAPASIPPRAGRV